MNTHQKTASELEMRYDLFVGKNNAYYTQKWEEMGVNNQKLSFNFAAFFFSILWLGYRKMYALTSLIALGYLIFSAIIYIIILRYDLVTNSQYIFEVLLVIISVFIGLFGNALYKRHAEKHYGKAINLTKEQSSLDNLLRAKGGTSFLGPLLSGMIFIFLISIPLGKLDEEIRIRDIARDQSEEITLIKNTVISGDYYEVDDFTLGDMYQNAFDNGLWEELEDDKVEFSGIIDIYDQPTEITVLFRIISQDDIRIESVSADDVVLDKQEANLLLDMVQLEHVKEVQK